MDCISSSQSIFNNAIYIFVVLADTYIPHVIEFLYKSWVGNLSSSVRVRQDIVEVEKKNRIRFVTRVRVKRFLSLERKPRNYLHKDAVHARWLR